MAPHTLRSARISFALVGVAALLALSLVVIGGALASPPAGTQGRGGAAPLSPPAGTHGRGGASLAVAATGSVPSSLPGHDGRGGVALVSAPTAVARAPIAARPGTGQFALKAGRARGGSLSATPVGIWWIAGSLIAAVLIVTATFAWASSARRRDEAAGRLASVTPLRAGDAAHGGERYRKAA
jgi:hypothetical protein